ncbi:glycoside hydrolase family 113 [Fibrisoma limi]|nr:glycoside hydrolase TIM-barrel-like domain-containing protein [Fibrisoma limi]
MISRAIVLLLVLLGCQSSPPFVHNGPKLKGVNLVAPRQQPGPESLETVRETGGEWVAVVPYGFCRKNEPHFYFSGNMGDRGKWQWWGETPTGVAETIRMARQQGLKVMLKPHVWMQGGSHLDLTFDRETDWQTFEADYRQYVLHFAHLADSLGVDLYCITTELDRFAVARPDFWKQLIRDVKTIYKGKLTYAANWDRYEQIPFWNELDYVGVDAYFPLSDKQDPSVNTLISSWRPHLRQLRAFSYRLQKSVLFTEFGYRSCTFSTQRPWESETDCSTNETAQANAYAALLEAVWPQPWFAGGFVWKWFMTDAHKVRERDQFSPQGKSAQVVLRKNWQ